MIDLSQMLRIAEGGEEPLSVERQAAIRQEEMLKRDVAERAYQRKVARLAKTLDDNEARGGEKKPLTMSRLSDVVSRSAAEAWRVDSIQSQRSKVLLVAQAKAGKTTLLLNYAKSLLTGCDFMGFSVTPLAEDECVGFMSFEMSGEQIKHWAEKIGVPMERVAFVDLDAAPNPLDDVEERKAVADYFQEMKVKTILFDTFGAAFNGDQNSASEVRPWLEDFNRWARGEAGADDIVLTVHMGHEGMRVRGSSSFLDWYDVLWQITRKGDGPNAARHFEASGRGIPGVEKSLVVFDPETMTQTLSSLAVEKVKEQQARAVSLADQIMMDVMANPGSITSAIAGRVKVKKETVVECLHGLVAEGRLKQTPGLGRSVHYSIVPAIVPE